MKQLSITAAIAAIVGAVVALVMSSQWTVDATGGR